MLLNKLQISKEEIKLRINILSLITSFTLFIPRIYNGKIIKIPIQDGIKVGISTERWMFDLLIKIHNVKKLRIFMMLELT